jgi:Protein of unknown function (DUF429)
MTRFYGIDFTSAPSSRKTITVAQAVLYDGCLEFSPALLQLSSFVAFEQFLANLTEGTLGCDLPLGLPAALLARLNWPCEWTALMRFLSELPKVAFKAELNLVRVSQPVGKRYLHRATDQAAGSHSPMKLVNPPVGLMLFEGAPRLARLGFNVLPCAPSNHPVTVLECYPGLWQRQHQIKSYKSDDKAKQTPARAAARAAFIHTLKARTAIRLPDCLALQMHADASGDTLDAVVCAVQAYTASTQPNHGIPNTVNPVEGWIVTC